MGPTTTVACNQVYDALQQFEQVFKIVNAEILVSLLWKWEEQV